MLHYQEDFQRWLGGASYFFHNYCRAIEGDICEHFVRLVRQAQVEEISLDDGHTRGRSKTLTQPGCQPWIFLRRNQLLAALCQPGFEDAFSGADFIDQVVLFDTAQIEKETNKR